MAKKVKNTKRKGSNFEREIAKILSEWWNYNLYKKGNLVFWRTHASGKIKNHSSTQFGDITYIHPDGKDFIDLFVIECKRTKRYNILGILANDKSIPMIEWLKKLKSEATQCNKFGMLIFKFDRYPIMIALDACISKKLCSLSKDFNNKRVMRLYKPHVFDLYLFDDFLKYVKREHIYQLKEILSNK